MPPTSPLEARLRPLLRLLGLLFPVAGCDGSDEYDMFTDVVDCSDLPGLARGLTAPPTSQALLSDLRAGSARVGLRWTDDRGEDWFLTRETTALIVSGPDETAWAIGVDLPCAPDARTFVHFAASDAQVVAGEFPITAYGFDVPALEQGTDGPTSEVDGTVTVTVTSAEAGHASGFMSGSGRTTLKSHITQESLGIDVEVTALAFREVRVE